MADKTIGELTKATHLDDDSLMIAEQKGAAVSVAGHLFKQFARDSVASFVAGAEQAAADAALAKEAAEAAAETAKDACDTAIENAEAQLSGYVSDAQSAAQAASTSANMAAESERNTKNTEAIVAADAAEAKAAKEAAERARDEAQSIAGGDFLEMSVYDPQMKKTDIFAYVDEKIRPVSISASDDGAGNVTISIG